MNKKILIPIIAFILILIGLGIYLIFQKFPVPKPQPRPINTFEECAERGYPILESYPRRCKTPDGRKFTEILGQNPINATKTCSELNGNICSSSQTCSGDWLSASDNEKCCSEECKDSLTPPTLLPSSTDSPFGFHPGSYTYIQDLGAKWSREGVYVAWEWADLNRDGNYNFTEAIAPSKPGVPNSGGKINYDTQWLQVPENIKILANVCPFRQGGDFKNSEEPEIYQNFVEKMAERYDGDDDYGCALSAPDCYKKGDSQYPVSKVIEGFKKNPIKYWQVCNQFYETCKKDCKNNYASSFALAQEKTYKGVKAADGSAYVLIAGDSGKDLYPEVFKKLNGKYIDIIDYHRYGNYNWYNPKQDFDFLKTSLQSSGFDITKLRFWIAETGTHSGDPSQRSGVEKNKLFQIQSEKQQAEGLVKAYVSALSYGIEKIFWAWDTVEGFGRNCGFFDYTGLIYDGCDCVNNKYTCGPNIGYDKGKDVKKLSYYTYKKMTETLEGSDWDNIQMIQESDGIYVYKFNNNGKPIWVAWNDNPTEHPIMLDVGNKRVKITEAIPKYESGKEVIDYGTAFNSYIQVSKDGKITIVLGDKPVFVEEQ